ncbi:MAG: LysR family transcriptional regulator [Rhodobacteraceae bacterium]|nr:LysR family transcriptional regulator [Paracoccaceae bacterium]
MIGKLEMFTALAREGHFGRAAESLGISQPSLSAGIRQLEEELGVQLVFRGSRFGGLTPEGQRALAHAQRILGDVRLLRAEMRARREGLSGVLRLAVIPTALTSAAALSHRIAAAHSGVQIVVLSRSSADILRSLASFEADAGLSYLDNEPLGRVTALPLWRERHVLVCPEAHPLARQERVAWADLAGVPLCLLTQEMQNRRIVDAALLAAGVTPEVRVESNSTIVLAAHVAAGGWATVLPEDMGAWLARGAGLAVRPLGGPTAGHAVGLIVPAHDVLTPVLQALRETATALAEEEFDS